MAFHDDLLTQAGELIHQNEPKSTQADLRRAVSTAYYALFHLLISETTLNWNRDSTRDAFGRMFDHALMRKASQRLLDSRLFPFAGEDPKLVQSLKTVAQAFVQLQDKRHIADYHNGIRWTPVESLREVATARKAFQIWASIRNQDLAQDCPPRGRLEDRTAQAIRAARALPSRQGSEGSAKPGRANPRPSSGYQPCSPPPGPSPAR